MSQVLTMAMICLLLFCGTFACGYLPSLIKAPPKVLNLIAIFGSATIIGAALIIILPESASILINSQHNLNRLRGEEINDEEIVDEELAGQIGSYVMLGFAIMLIITETFVIIQEKAAEQQKEKAPKYQRVSTNADDLQEKASLIPKEKSDAVEKECEIAKDVRASQSALLATIALCAHSLTEGVAMGSALYRKYTP